MVGGLVEGVVERNVQPGYGGTGQRARQLVELFEDVGHAVEIMSIRGKIDRLDVAAGQTPPAAFVIDYKYSAPERVKERREDPNLLQAPLYLMAAEKHFHLRPAGMFYAGVKGQIRYVGWGDGAPVESEPIPEDWFSRTTARTLGAVGEIRGGRVEPAPANPAKCRFCAARDICRIEAGQAEAPAALAEGV